MPRISLTDFVDVVSASGVPRATKVRQIKHRPPYNPAIDFYKPLKDSILEIHQKGQNKEKLSDLLFTLNDEKKRTAYPEIIQGYLKWWGRKNLTWFQPPNKLYEKFGIEVSVNPELGLSFDNQFYLIKLYFKADPLTKNRIDIITHLMAIAVLDSCASPEKSVMAGLDVRRSKLITPTVPIEGLTGMLIAELSYISALWPSV
jgi:hypothetical protein